MPTGTPYHSYILPYRIRVDDFATPLNQDPSEAPLLHLLTHTHSDHINGLSAKSFGYKVYCSEDAKQMLLRHEVYAERELQALELRSEKIRTYSHLRVDPLLCPDGTMYYTGSRDLLSTLPLNTPTRVELSGEETVVITLLDANHCLGAVMFLIEGSKGAILHTGDFRAEPWFLDSLARNPLLQRYLSPQHQEHLPSNAKQPLTYPVSTTLEAIYLDTASTLSNFQIVTKDCATAGLIELMKIFPDSVYFFINCWTWGYEDILKAVAREFQSQIHVDRYKHSIYHHVSDPFLGLITTLDPSSTRFHACERFHRCSFVAVDKLAYPNSTSHMGKRVIYVNPVKMESEKWDLYQKDTKSRLVAGEEINNLLVPLSRHSTLPELQSFVKLFRPKRIVPNTLDPRLHGLDWTCIDRMFSNCLHSSAQSSASSSQPHLGITGRDQLTDDDRNDIDVALKNLVGDGASDAAQRWADHGKLLQKLATVRDYLGKGERDVVDKLLNTDNRSTRLVSGETYLDPPEDRTPKDKGKGKGTNAARYYARESEEDTDFSHSDDERGKTAHKLFASLAGIDDEDKENKWWFSPPSSPPQIENIASTSAQHVVLVDTSQKRRRKYLTDEGPSSTPVSSRKRRRALGTVDPEPGITLHEIKNVVVSSSAVSSKKAMSSNQATQIPSGESLIPTEREKLALKRMDIAQQLANIYPHLVAPSYEKKRAKQLAKLQGKGRGRSDADGISTKQKLVQTRTVFSFETVDDDDGGMDWNRSKRLADDLRDAVVNGRKPVLPSLNCAQSPSPSLMN